MLHLGKRFVESLLLTVALAFRFAAEISAVYLEYSSRPGSSMYSARYPWSVLRETEHGAHFCAPTAFEMKRNLATAFCFCGKRGLSNSNSRYVTVSPSN